MAAPAARTMELTADITPDGVTEALRAGKLAAAGALVGAVMKTTSGKADAPRVRELILERLS